MEEGAVTIIPHDVRFFPNTWSLYTLCFSISYRDYLLLSLNRKPEQLISSTTKGSYEGTRKQIR